MEAKSTPIEATPSSCALEINSASSKSTSGETSPSSSYTLEIASPENTQVNNSQEAPKTAHSTNLQTSFNLFNSFFGNAILALPLAYKQVGLGLALVVVVIVNYLTTHCLLLLTRAAADKNGTGEISLQKLASKILGTKAKMAVQVALFIMQLGACIALIIFVKMFLDHVLCAFNIDALCGNTLFSIVFCLAVTIPLAMFNNMHYFYLPSLAAIVFIITGLGAQTYYNIELLTQATHIKENFISQISQFNILDLPLFFGVASYSFEGVGVVLNIRNSMKKPQSFPKLLKGLMVVMIVLYVSIPTICNLALGDNIQQIVFFNLPTNNIYFMIVQILSALSTLISFPIALFPVVRMLENSKKLKSKVFNETGETKNKMLRYGMRLILLALIFFVAYTVPDMILFLNLIGSLVVTFVGFVLPIWLYHVQFKGRVKITMRVFNFAVVGVTVVLGAIGVVMSIAAMI